MKRVVLPLVIVLAMLFSSVASSMSLVSSHKQKIPWPWIAIADCESGDGDGKPPYRPWWRYNVGLYDGGLNFHPTTWTMATKLYRHGSTKYRYAWQAPAIVQVRVAQRWLRATSWEQWPVCSRRVGVR